MVFSFTGALVGCAGGAAVAVCNDMLTRAVYKKDPSHLTRAYAARQLINLAYLGGLYFLAATLSWEAASMLIGGALGITVPSFFFAARLVKLNSSRVKDTAPVEPAEEGEVNGRDG